MQRYGPGDVVEITVDFLHQMRIKNVTALFVNQQNPIHKFEMSGVPRFYDNQPAWEQHGVLRSHADFTQQIPAEAGPGTYTLQRLELTTYSDKPYTYEGEKLGKQIATFEVMPESEDPPIIQRSFISPLT